jgi:tetratricopeptide (TPR) repeat protein
MNNILDRFIEDPYNDEVVFNLANFYLNQNQTSSALTYYLRVTEYSNNSDLIYESLIKAGLCIEKQGNRVYSTKGLYLHAISQSPKRPEAYFLLSRLYERNREWQESYTIASIAESVCEFDLFPLRTNIEYPGKYGFKFEKAVCSWWMGLIDESLELFLSLDEHEIMDELHTTSVKNNLKMLTNS